jgi:hypothetical protein
MHVLMHIKQEGENRMMNKTKTRLLLGGMAIGAIAAASLSCSPAAHADGKLANEYKICQMLEANPSFATIDYIAAGLVPVVGVKAAADDLVDATTYICPQFAGLVDSYARSRAGYTSSPPSAPDNSVQRHTVV